MVAYYNEFDKNAAQWLRNLINAGHIAPGVVDERSIEDVTPNDLIGFTQCHFFAGVGVWSLALRNAGWDDHRPVWTASCPCQPFSAAGAGAGFDDERHLWPALQRLVEQRRPTVIIGEQVASKFVEPWVDLVHADLEGMGYAFGCIPFPSAGVGAPHIRDRLYWMANADREQHNGRRNIGERRRNEHTNGISNVRLGDPSRTGLDQCRCVTGIPGIPIDGGAGEAVKRTGVHAGGLADTDCSGQRSSRRGGMYCESESGSFDDVGGQALLPGPTNGYWRDADWLGCTDGKWRPVEPGTFPLAHGAAARVGRLRAYGNAINAEAARVFIQAAMTVLD